MTALENLAPPIPGLLLAPALPYFVLPSVSDLAYVATASVLPQLALKLTNAISVTAALARELLGTGVANLLALVQSRCPCWC